MLPDLAARDGPQPGGRIQPELAATRGRRFSAYHAYEGEGHGWRKTETIEQFYTTLNAFLRQYVVFA
jgi:hypothetical protein